MPAGEPRALAHGMAMSLQGLGGMEHWAGPFHAPIRFEEYGDYECPYTLHAEPLIQELRRSFGPTLRFRFHNYPLHDLHPHAERAAEAAEAAGEQGKFWEMHDLLLANSGHLSLPDLIQAAEQIGLDLERFEEELTNRSYFRGISEEIRVGRIRGVRGTPEFFINEIRYEGAISAPSLREAIQRALDQEVIRRAI